MGANNARRTLRLRPGPPGAAGVSGREGRPCLGGVVTGPETESLPETAIGEDMVDEVEFILTEMSEKFDSMSVVDVGLLYGW